MSLRLAGTEMGCRIIALLVLVQALVGCSSGSSDVVVLRLATTTSTADSGLLDAILPAFEEEYQARVDVVAVGTGQAIGLGKAGDADVILVHSRAREDAFVAEGHGTERSDAMANDFVIVGPDSDPASIRGVPIASDALGLIAAREATFASRGDDSGTHTKEQALWRVAGIEPAAGSGWYKSLGQGMGDTLNFANETGAYTLTDRGTFLTQQASLPNLTVLLGGITISENVDPALMNPYGVIPVNPDKGNINSELAQRFVQWLTSVETQSWIEEFGVDTFGQPPFYPASDEWRAQVMMRAAPGRSVSP